MLFAQGESTVRIAGLGAVIAGVAIVAAVRLQG
jgi:uncharacterized protein YjeT (DUF2065 family)